MGRGYWRGYFPPAPPKLPPPERGIKVKRFGATWWGQRWVEALEGFGFEYSARLGRGRSYARQGRVHDLTVKGGVITAHVTGSRPTPYRVTMRLTSLTGRVWQAAIKRMASRAAFAARLLAEDERQAREARGERREEEPTKEAGKEEARPEPPKEPARPRRFHGSVNVDPTRLARDAGQIAQEVVQHLTGLVGAKVEISLEIQAVIPEGAPDQVVRTVTENCRTLKFTTHGFEQS